LDVDFFGWADFGGLYAVLVFTADFLSGELVLADLDSSAFVVGFDFFRDFDLGDFDLGDFDLGDFDLGDFDLGDFDLGDFV
jgi:hypothetical protein